MADIESLIKARKNLDEAIQRYVTEIQGEGIVVTDWILTTEASNGMGSFLLHYFSDTMTKWKASGLARRAFSQIVSIMES